MYDIHIEDGEKLKCPHCEAVFAIENKNEILYRNITLFHLIKETQEKQVKCKNCKAMIKIS
jgi:uncharacterized C2H2 Zn-finger protein